MEKGFTGKSNMHTKVCGLKGTGVSDSLFPCCASPFLEITEPQVFPAVLFLNLVSRAVSGETTDSLCKVGLLQIRTLRCAAGFLLLNCLAH